MKDRERAWNLGGAQTYLQLLQDKAFLFTSVKKNKTTIKLVALADA